MNNILSSLIILIGLYMIIMFNGGGWLTPPVISGVAFVLIGVRTCTLIGKVTGKREAKEE